MRAEDRVGVASRPLALVIGLSIHGLAVVRALARAGVEVHALAQAADSPAWHTRYARVLLRESINSDDLVNVLVSLRCELPAERPVVLFPTSDNMVRAIANGWSRLADRYIVSWAAHRETVLELQRKDGIAAYCERAGVHYPRSAMVRGAEDCASVSHALSFPLAVKPVRPLSSFKVIRVASPGELRAVIENYAADLPFLAQEWVEGDERQLYFCTMYVEQGRSLVEFTGRKIRSMPRATGMGTVVESRADGEVRDIARRFVSVLDYSGPIAIEFKRDRAGRYWLIEPNLGRTEYSVDLLVQYGINLPAIEFYRALGLPPPPVTHSEPTPVVWYDTERDPLAYVSACLRQRTLRPHGGRPVFPFLGHGDPGPFRVSTYLWARRVLRAAMNRMLRRWRSAIVAVTRYRRLADLPQAAIDLLRAQEEENLFLGLGWYRVFESEVGVRIGTPEWYCVTDPASGRLLAVWPFLRRCAGGGDTLEAMANYFTPYITLPLIGLDAAETDAVYCEALRAILRSCGRLIVRPVAPDTAFANAAAARRRQGVLVPWRDVVTVNWYQPVGGWSAYWQAREAQLRNTLARKTRKLEREAQARIEIVTTPEAVQRVLGDYFKVYDQSWKRQEEYPDFIAGLIRMAAEAGWLRLGILYVDGDPAAAHLWLVQNRTAYIYKLAYDEKFERWSVGTQLTARMFEQAIEKDGVTRIDYLTGNDPYKRKWMDHYRPLYAICIVNLLKPLGVASLGRELLARAWRGVRAALPGGPHAPPGHG